MSVTNADILKALSTVIEPDLGQDLVSLGMIHGLSVNGNDVSFAVQLTTPACPLKDLIRAQCVKAIEKQFGSEIQVHVEMTADVTSAGRNQSGGIPGVKNTIAVASGKGGVGKSTIAVNLAVALARSGAHVGLLDTDIYGPSIPTMFGVNGERPRVSSERKIIPIEQHGVKLLSIGFLVDDDQAAIWRGPMVTSAVQQFLREAEWGDLDYLVLDLPPGTGDIQLTLVQTLPLTGAIIVSTPQEVALADARRGIAMFRKVNVPILGIVENMAYFTPPDLPDRKYFLFGEAGARRLSDASGIPLLGEIPIQQTVRESGDNGVPIVIEQPNSVSGKALIEMASKAAQQVSIQNAIAHSPIEIEVVE